MPGCAPQSPDAVRYDRRASFSACSTCRSTHHAPDILAGKLPPLHRCRRRSCRHPARRPANLRAAPFCRRRITSFRGRTRLCMFREMLLLPRSAPPAPPRVPAHTLRRRGRARLPHGVPGASCHRSAPSIFGTPRFGGYVVTRFLADADLHGHRPTVATAPAPSLSVLCSATHPPPRFTPPCGPCLPRTAHWRAPDAPGHARLPRSEFVGCAPILSTAASCARAAVLRDISAGTSYQIVRLVFRPYAHVLPSSCTSE